MLYDISPPDFAHHVRHATSWNDLGFRCGLEKNKIGKIHNHTKMLQIQEKVNKMRLDTDHFIGQRIPLSDDDFKTIVKESDSLSRVLRKCKVQGRWWQEQILKKIEDLCIDTKHFKLRKPRSEYKLLNKLDVIDDETFKTLVNNNTTWISLALACGYKGNGGHKYIQNRTERLGLDTSHYGGNEFDNDQIFVVESQYTDSANIKKRLLRDFDLVYECAACKNEHFTKCDDGVLMWNNKAIVLQLEHKNGINNDNRIDNLEFLCPSCHSQTSTFCGGNSKKYKAGQAWIEDGKTEYKPGSIASLLN